MTPRLSDILTTCLIMAAGLAGTPALRAQATGKTAPDAAHRVAGARAAAPPHYADALRVHDAVVRGDLAAARESAGRLGAHPETGIPEKGASYAAAMRQAAAQGASAADVAAAGTSAATMLSTCGECHRALGARPVMDARPTPSVGETVGHMLDHLRATEQLMHGLVVPSSTAWNDGAQILRTAALGRGKLPRDPKLTSDLVAAETRLHQLADRATAATETPDRVAVYGEMIGTCASCHSLHPNVWGPGKR